MKHLAAAVACLCALTVAAQPASRTINVRVHDSFTMQILGATAAFAVDSTIADAAANSGTVTIFGRGTGRTQVVVVSLTGQTTFDVIVAERRTLAQSSMTTRSGTDGRVEARYVSARREIHNTVDITTQSAKKRTELHVENVNYGETSGTRATATLPSISYRVFTRGRELAFLDRLVDHSALTLTSSTIRGIHYLDDQWRVHAGYTAYTAYQSFLLPTERQTVLGAAWSTPLTAHTRITPGVFVYPGNGHVASLLLDYARDERTTGRAEAGLSNGKIGAAGELTLERSTQRLHLDARYRPNGFAVVAPGQPRGLFLDGSWSMTAGRANYDAAVSASDFDLPGLDQRTISATTNARLRISDFVSLLGGASYGSFNTTRSLTVPAGIQYETPRFGVTALYRWSENSSTNRGGGGFRLAARASAGRVFATAYVDHQKQAPTLALIFREQPDLALALAQLGITATTPADIARALRENSALIELGYIDGVTVDLAPSRTQAGFEVAWLGAGASRPQLRARVLFNRTETVATHTGTIIATLTGSRRITESTDLFAAWTYWLTRRRGQADVVQPVVEAGVRHRFDHLPSLGARGSITGTVFIDEDLDGTPDGAGVADAVIEVDGAPRATSAASGSFAVRGLQGTSHRVTARVPHLPDAYFTTPSRVEASNGGIVRFGVAMTPARVFGRITSDAGEGLGAITVALTRGSARFTASSSSDGSFAIDAPPGEWELAIDSSSLSPGFTTEVARSVSLVRATPLGVELTVRANRSISGRAPAGVTSITIDALGTSIPVAADGRFSVRSLPAGEVTLRARSGRREFSLRVSLPSDPAVIDGVVLR